MSEAGTLVFYLFAPYAVPLATSALLLRALSQIVGRLSAPIVKMQKKLKKASAKGGAVSGNWWERGRPVYEAEEEEEGDEGESGSDSDIGKRQRKAKRQKRKRDVQLDSDPDADPRAPHPALQGSAMDFEEGVATVSAIDGEVDRMLWFLKEEEELQDAMDAQGWTGEDREKRSKREKQERKKAAKEPRSRKTHKHMDVDNEEAASAIQEQQRNQRLARLLSSFISFLTIGILAQLPPSPPPTASLSAAANETLSETQQILAHVRETFAGADFLSTFLTVAAIESYGRHTGSSHSTSAPSAAETSADSVPLHDPDLRSYALLSLLQLIQCGIVASPSSPTSPYSPLIDAPIVLPSRFSYLLPFSDFLGSMPPSQLVSHNTSDQSLFALCVLCVSKWKSTRAAAQTLITSLGSAEG
jgi:hypothetical protein